MSEENKKAYYQALKNAFADGVIDNSEWQMLETLRTTLSISLEEHHQMENEIRNDNTNLRVEKNKSIIKDNVINRSTVTNIAKVEIKDKDTLDDILDNEKDLFKTKEEMNEALKAFPIKDEIKTILELIDSKINREKRDNMEDDNLNWEEKTKGASQIEFRDALKICEKNLEEENNPYLWAIKGYCTAMLGNYDLGKEFIIKAFQVTYTRKSQSKKYDKFRQYLFDTRNLLLAINKENQYLVQDIATLGRTNYHFQPINTDIRLKHPEDLKDDDYDEERRKDDLEFRKRWYYRIGTPEQRKARRGGKKTTLPRYILIPKLKGGKVINKGKLRTGDSDMVSKSYLPIQQFLEENEISQKEAVNIFAEFKELYSIVQDNNIAEISKIFKNYKHDGGNGGASFLIFLKTICDEMIDVLAAQISDIQINDSEMEEATRKIWKARNQMYQEQSDRREKFWQSKPGFWQSYLTDGGADTQWKEKSYQNDWDNFLSDAAINITDNWEKGIDNIIKNNSEKIIAYKHKMNEIHILRKAIILFNQLPLHLETDKFRIFISNYEIMIQNLDIYENLSQLEQDLFYKRCKLEYDLRTSGWDKKIAKQIWDIQHKCTRSMIKETSAYFHCEESWTSMTLNSGDWEIGVEKGFQINQYESDIQDYNKVISDFKDEKEYKAYSDTLFSCNDKKINTKLFSYDDFIHGKKMKFNNGALMEVDAENTNLQLNFSWIQNGKMYPAHDWEDSDEFLELNKELLKE